MERNRLKIKPDRRRVGISISYVAKNSGAESEYVENECVVYIKRTINILL